VIGLWRWLMNRRPAPDPGPAQARERAERRLEEAQARWPEVHAARRDVDAMAVAVERAMRGAR
jgi:hypothetical protein